jgi:hypothetical protein
MRWVDAQIIDIMTESPAVDRAWNLPMKSPSLKDKVAYYAKVREANYASSLRLEGFSVPSKAAGKHGSEPSSRKKADRNRM